MLPEPVQYYSRKTGSRHHHDRPWRDVLLMRARVTNLGFILLLTFSVFSCLLNLYYWLFSGPRTSTWIVRPHSIWSTISRDNVISSLEHLVIVPGHAVWKGSRQEDTLVEDAWLMESFQYGDKAARINAYHKHISHG